MTVPSRVARALLRAGSAVALSAVALLLLAGPALAEHVGSSEGEEPGPRLSTLASIALFVLLPALILAVVGALAWLPNVRGGPRYRPQRGWSAAPVWFAGPSEPAQALTQGQPVAENRGGAHGTW